MKKQTPLRKKGTTPVVATEKKSTLVRVSVGTAKLLTNLRTKYSGPHGERSINLVIRGLWRDVCDFDMMKKKRSIRYSWKINRAKKIRGDDFDGSGP